MRQTVNIAKYQDIMVFVEIQDHEQILEGSLELLSKARHLADKLEQKLFAVVFGKDVLTTKAASNEFLIACQPSVYAKGESDFGRC